MKLLSKLLIIQVTLLLLACTNFTFVTFWFEGIWSISFGEYTHKSGFGTPYRYDYSLSQVICYICAYALGLKFFRSVQVQFQSKVNVLCLFICLVGLASFLIELTHWGWNHNFSLIASVPSLLIVYCIYIAIKINKTPNQSVERDG